MKESIEIIMNDLVSFLFRIKMMVDLFGYLLFALGLHFLLATVRPSDGTWLVGTQITTFSI